LRGGEPASLPPGPRVKRILYVLALAAVAGCGLGTGSAMESTIVDSLGRTIVLPQSVARIVSLQPEITRIVIALGAGERLVGIDYFFRENDHLFPIIFPRGRELPAVSNTPEDMNFEIVTKLDPDVVFVSPTELQMVEALQGKLRKPVVALASMGSFEKLLDEIRILGRILGREKRAGELADDFRSRTENIRKTVSAIPTEKRPRVYLSFWGSLTRTPVSYEPVETAGGVNLAAALAPAYLGTTATVVQIEQIIAWRPDIVLVQGNYPPRERAITVRGIIGDARLGSLPAVRDGAVFYTFGFWYWWDPAEVLLETLYLARLFHPESFGRFDLEEEGNAIFKKYYGIEGGFSILCRTLDCGGWGEPR
jgi:iron complex transport system substrate-binding protein